MAQIDNKGLHHNKMTGIFEFYSLNSIKQKPKSGYDIIKEIDEKSKGNIKASKGTVYPILDKLEKEDRIQVKEILARGKKIFSITKKGEKFLKELDKKDKGIRDKMRFIPILFSDFKNIHTGLEMKLFDVKKIIWDLDDAKDKKKADEILKKTIDELIKIKPLKKR